MAGTIKQHLSEQACVGDVQSLLDRGQFFLAQDLAQQAMSTYPESWRLCHQRCLALVQVGGIDEAQRLVEPFIHARTSRPMQRDDNSAEELLGLRARLHKNLWPQTGRNDELRTSRDLYLEAFKVTGGTFTGINAASLSWILAERDLARKLAQNVLDICERTPPVNDADDSEAYWRPATIGEAALLLGKLERANAAYTNAAEWAHGRHRFTVASRRQLLLLQDNGLAVPNSILEALAPPTVVVFTGEMIDVVGTSSTRFPPDIEDAVREALEKALDNVSAGIGYSSAACGADLLFVEALRERGAEVNIGERTQTLATQRRSHHSGPTETRRHLSISPRFINQLHRRRRPRLERSTPLASRESRLVGTPRQCSPGTSGPCSSLI